METSSPGPARLSCAACRRAGAPAPHKQGSWLAES